MSQRRRLPGVLWLLYFALRNAVRAAYYLGAIPSVWTEEGLHGPWIYLGMAALAWALTFGVSAGLWWRKGPAAAQWILGGMVLYQLHSWVHRLFLMRSPFVAQSHGFALLVSLLTLVGTAWFLGLLHGRSRA